MVKLLYVNCMARQRIGIQEVFKKNLLKPII